MWPCQFRDLQGSGTPALASSHKGLNLIYPLVIHLGPPYICPEVSVEGETFGDIYAHV